MNPEVFLIIETESFNFNNAINNQTVIQGFGLSDLQKQYLSYLIGGDSVEKLVVQLLNNGWLVNFSELYQLVEKLVQNKMITNLNIIQYFNSHNQILKNQIRSNPLSESKPKHEILDQLLNLPFFRSLPKDLSLLLIQKSVIKKYSADAVICKTGDQDRNMYVLLSGQAAIYKQTETGQKFISMIGTNGLFGESSFLTGSVKSADIITTQTCDILCIPYQAEILDPLLNQNVAHQIIKRFWIQNALANSEFFKKIPPDCLDALTFTGTTKSLKNEEILFKQNDPSAAAYLIIQGQIKIIQNGKIISSLVQGDFFGEISLTMTNGVRSATAFSHGPTTVLEINRNHFYNLLSKNLFLAKEIQALAFNRMNKDQNRILK